MKTLTSEENAVKERAKRMHERAARETGVRKGYWERPELPTIFDAFPQDLEALDDLIHDLKAKADLCTGTDRSVSWGVVGVWWGCSGGVARWG